MFWPAARPPHSHPIALLHGLNRNRTMYRTPWASCIQSRIYRPEFLLSSTKVWMRVSSSKIFSVSLTISLQLSHVNPSLLTEIDKLYMWQTVQKKNSRRRSHYSPWLINYSNLTYHLPLLFDELVKNGARAKWSGAIKMKENSNRRK